MNSSDFLFANPSFFEGMARIFDFGNTLNIYNSSPDEDTADSLALWLDWRATGFDIEAAIEEYEEQLEEKAA